ncbi:MAG: phosphatidylglycerophosphatase A [Parahaliea sp.]
MSLEVSRILRNPIHLLAFGFGSGLSPKAPGTFGTLAAIPFYYLLAGFSLPIYSLFIVFAFALGVWLCEHSSRDLGVHDHPGIVWDEFVGFWLTMWAVPPGWQTVLLGFVFFRLFDIIKPWPIGWLDRRVHGGLGIMIDDVVAGVMAGAILHLIMWVVPAFVVV